MNELTVLFFGKTGAGKSSTLNSLFSLNLATDNAVACTKEPHITYLEKAHYSHLNLSYDQVRIVDMPGIGESIRDDEKYMSFYEQWIPQTQTLVWVTQADTRAYKRDEVFLLKLKHLFHPSMLLIVALNKIDCLGVDEGKNNFCPMKKTPSDEQIYNLPDKINDIYNIFSNAISHKIKLDKSQIIPYTSSYGWGLQELKDKIFLRS